MNCERAQNLLIDFLYGEAPEGDMKGLSAHLKQCSICAEMLASYSRIRSMAEGLKEPVPSQMVMGRLIAHARDEAKHSGAFWGFGWFKVMATVCVMAVVAGLVTFQIQSGMLTDSAEIVASSQIKPDTPSKEQTVDRDKAASVVHDSTSDGQANMGAVRSFSVPTTSVSSSTNPMAPSETGALVEPSMTTAPAQGSREPQSQTETVAGPDSRALNFRSGLGSSPKPKLVSETETFVMFQVTRENGQPQETKVFIQKSGTQGEALDGVSPGASPASSPSSPTGDSVFPAKPSSDSAALPAGSRALSPPPPVPQPVAAQEPGATRAMQVANTGLGTGYEPKGRAPAPSAEPGAPPKPVVRFRSVNPLDVAQPLAEGQKALEAKDFSRAVDVFKEVVAMLPPGNSDRWTAILGLARAYEGQGNIEQAKTLYEILAQESKEHRDLALGKLKGLKGE